MSNVQHTVRVSLSAEEMKGVSDPIFAVINALQDKYTIDQVLMALLYSTGASIAQRGGHLLLDSPLRRALPPLVKGYEDAIRDAQSEPGDASNV